MALIDFSALIQWFIELVQAYGPWSVFIGILLEEIIVPIPSALIIMAAGFVLVPAGVTLAEASVQIFFDIVIPGTIASAIGSLFIYAVAHYGGEALVQRFPRFFGTTVKEIEKMGDRLEKSKRTWLLIIFLRAVPVVPTSIVSLACGFLHLEWKRFFLATLIGSMPRIFILGYIGWQIGFSYSIIGTYLNAAEQLVFVLIALVIISVFWMHKKRKWIFSGRHFVEQKGVGARSKK